MALRLDAVKPFWANPVVTRDLRVQMRGTKSYWNQAAYLLLLGLLAVAGYAQATTGYGSGPSGMSVVLASGKLEQFFRFIFTTLAALICLIAPALTAASITGERQRLTLDLLVTTPLTPAELLVGKLISSIAFLLLLLALSLPASALCVILGGATLGDVFQVYLLLAIDGLVLAAIGLYFSCAVRASLLALIWTYLAVGAFLLVTLAAGSVLGMGGAFWRGPTAASPGLSLAALNPFLAVSVGMRPFEVLGVRVPVWVGTGALALLFLRLLVTAASYRLGSYGGGAAPSLRRQVLFLTGLGTFLVSYGILQRGGVPGAFRSTTLEFALIGTFLLAVPFLPGLFTPAAKEDASPGQPIPGGSYHLRRAFQPEHAGALPFFHLWLVVLVGAALAGALAAGQLAGHGGILLLTMYYLSGAGYLCWALSRRAATFVATASGARALAFGLYVITAALPLMLMGLTDRNLENNPIGVLWLFYPLLKPRQTEASAALVLSGTLAYLLGTLVFPFWRAVIPGGQEKKEAFDAG